MWNILLPLFYRLHLNCCSSYQKRPQTTAPTWMLKSLLLSAAIQLVTKPPVHLQQTSWCCLWPRIITYKLNFNSIAYFSTFLIVPNRFLEMVKEQQLLQNQHHISRKKLTDPNIDCSADCLTSIILNSNY